MSNVINNTQQGLLFPNISNLSDHESKEGKKNKAYKTAKGETIQFQSAAATNNKSATSAIWEHDASPRPVGNRRDGEFANAERQYTKVGLFNFFGNGNKIKSANDVAYIFRHLESEAVEHSFAVYIDAKKNYQVQWLGMGGIAGTVIDPRVMVHSASLFKAKQIYFVHNHPSGSLKPSQADLRMLDTLGYGFKNFDVRVQGIIINVTSGKYLLFNEQTRDELQHGPVNDKRPIEILAFNRAAFLNPPSGTIIRQGEDVAQFLSQQRFSAGEKTGYIVLNTANEIVANFFATKSTAKEMTCEIADIVSKYSGAHAIAYTNSLDQFAKYRDIKKELNHFSIELLDVIVVEQSEKVISNYKSLVAEGYIGEALIGYQKTGRSGGKNEENVIDLKDKLSSVVESGCSPVVSGPNLLLNDQSPLEQQGVKEDRSRGYKVNRFL